ncbi:MULTISPECIES: serine/threonine transporter [Salinivibrio]|uniref:HAAAP family serine/threonine permease n=1 Tax=Salinivibrio siamensis TaxID=414286 RepID=A0ABX3K7I8_9GAMM|nr:MULTISPECIES: serine/threonine transporter [Salinivibrio]KKA45662.1 serine/threonine protein kinase [Salinivibrio sp. KP-1]OOE73185.1 HAAAP family serine/threonine permease [Salinivibrio sp. ML290]OOE78871.1 HAAAP family serine/threonine permease [Salinivibrio sp. ML198]OOE83861.1 HAAAP family serine/threonine permease [Salinivibrio siamensis]OOE84037.1 HAAAP family serine/threonine permease [Salinivibrio sp. PR6]
MQTTSTTGTSATSRPRWTKQDTTWALSLFGTAVGAGILFLPINAGMSGFWPLVVMTLLVGPMTFFAHRGLSRFVLSSKNAGSDITEVVEEHFGVGAGKLITLLYFFAIYPIVLIYGVGITNTVDSFLVNQLGMASPPRAILSLALILGMMSVMLLGEKMMLRVTQFLVYPLVGILVFMSIYLIPEWNTAALSQVPSAGDFAITLWISIPVLVFAFNHSPAISSFSLAQRRDHGDEAEYKSGQILMRSAAMLVGFVMLFVFSCVLSLTPADLAAAKAENIAILSYLANKHESPFISFLGPLVAFVAIVSSFFGHYLGAREGLNGIATKALRSMGKPVDRKKIDVFTVVFMILTIWLVATLNPSILGMIESLGGPIIATILFIMPMYAVKNVPAMQKYSGTISNAFVLIMGLVAISAITYSMIS